MRQENLLKGLTRTEVGHDWYQSLALTLRFRCLYIIFFYLKEHHSLKKITPVSAFKDHKNLLWRINVAPATNAV
jgi:hypothetical protein